VNFWLVVFWLLVSGLAAIVLGDLLWRLAVGS